MTTRRIGSGSRSSPWPPTYSPGPRPWPSTSVSPPDDGNPNDCASGSSPSPDASSTASVEDDSDSHATGPGTGSSTPAGPRSAPPEGIPHPNDQDPENRRRQRRRPSTPTTTDPAVVPLAPRQPPRRNIEARACLPIPGGAGRRPDHSLGALPTLQRRPVCARAGAFPARAWTTPASTPNWETRPSCPGLVVRGGPRDSRTAPSPRTRPFCRAPAPAAPGLTAGVGVRLRGVEDLAAGGSRAPNRVRGTPTPWGPPDWVSVEACVLLVRASGLVLVLVVVLPAVVVVLAAVVVPAPVVRGVVVAALPAVLGQLVVVPAAV